MRHIPVRFLPLAEIGRFHRWLILLYSSQRKSGGSVHSPQLLSAGSGASHLPDVPKKDRPTSWVSVNIDTSTAESRPNSSFLGDDLFDEFPSVPAPAQSHATPAFNGRSPPQYTMPTSSSGEPLFYQSKSDVAAQSSYLSPAGYSNAAAVSR